MSRKSTKTKEEREFDEFYRTPCGSFMSALGNYNFLIEQMIQAHPEEETLKTEFDESSDILKFYVESFENFERLEEFYIDDKNLLLALLESMDVEKREKIFKIIGTYIQIAEKSEENAVFTNLLPVVQSYNATAPVFSAINLGEQKYAVLLRQVFRFSIKNSELFIDNPKNETELDFGYEYKNYTLICRSKMKQVSSNPDELKFIFDFFDLLSKQEQIYFFQGILASFIDCCQSDLDKDKLSFENELEFVAVARQIQWELDKKYKITKRIEKKNEN